MNLLIEHGDTSYGFATIFTSIYDQIDKRYPEHNVTKVKFKKQGFCLSPAGRCGHATMNIINLDNTKTVILSFWDRGMDLLIYDSFPDWSGLDVVHVIGGLGMTPDLLSTEKYSRVKWSPFLYPLQTVDMYRDIEKHRTPYVFDQKIKKACFIGTMYDRRQMITDSIGNHPLFDIFTYNDGYRREEYVKKMNEYAITLSFNGNGELSLRDWESMGLGIPIIRSEVLTPLYGKLTAGVNYIRGSDASYAASHAYYANMEPIIGEQFVDTMEKLMYNNDPSELLSTMSTIGIDYFNENVYPEKIVEKFFEVFDITLLL